MGKKTQARKLRAQKTLADNNGHWDWFMVNAIALCASVGLFILLLATDKTSKDYYYVHNGALIVFLLAFLSFLVRRSVNENMYHSIGKMFFKNKRLSLYEKGDILLALSYSMFFFSFLLVDLSLIKSFGLRISAVGAVAAFELLRKFVFPNKNVNLD